MISALLSDGLLIGALCLLGGAIAKLLIPAATRLEYAGLAYPLGSGILAWTLFILSWLGVHITIITVSFVYFFSLLIVFGGNYWRFRTSPSGIMNGKRTGAELEVGGSRSAKVLLGILIALATIAAFISIGRSYSRWDSLAIWSIKGYGIALEGSIFAANSWGAHELGYPLNVPLQISFFKMISGDVVPGSKLIFPLFYLSLLLGCYAFWVRQGVKDRFAGYGVVLLGTLPYIYLYSTVGYANVPMTCYLVLGAVWGVTGINEDDRYMQLASSILLGLAILTRVEGVLHSAFIIMGIWVAWFFVKRRRIHYTSWLIPIGIVGGSWLCFFKLFGTMSSDAVSASQHFLAALSQEGLNLHPLRIIISYARRYLFHISIWGLLFPIIGIIFAVHWRKFHPIQHPRAFSILLAAMGTAVVTVTLFYVGSFISGGFFGWLQRGFPRAFFPSAVLFTVAAFLAFTTERAKLSPIHSEYHGTE